MSTPNPQDVRRADSDDLAALIESAYLLLLESALQPVSQEKVIALVTRCIERDGAIAGILSGPAGIEASIGLVIDEFAYSSEQHLSVAWMGVHSAFRKSTHASKLIEFAIWAQGILRVPLFADLSTLDSEVGRLHLYLRTMPQIGARFSWGSEVMNTFQQAIIGHDPHGERTRSHAKFAVRSPPAQAA